MTQNEIPKDVFYAFDNIRTYRDLESINGIKFTRREIDNMACILGGRKGKATASLLSIKEKTVDTYIKKIGDKLACNSRERIRARLEESEKCRFIKRHYENLLTESYFEQTLQKISLSIRQESSVCLFITWENEIQNSFDRFKKHLNQLNIKFLVSSREQHKSFTSFTEYVREQRASFVLYALSQNSINSSLLNKSRIAEEITEISQKITCSFVFLLEGKEKSLDVNQSERDSHCIFVNEEANYYSIFFNILKRIIPNSNIEDIISAFKKQHDKINDSLSKPFFNELDLNHFPQNKSLYPSLSLDFFKNKKGRIVAAGLSLIISIIILFTVVGNPINSNKGNKIQISTIRSDFSIPAESVFLYRSEFISQIGNKFKTQAGIHTVALVGVGGAGKTTLAREFARQEKANIVRELNAETSENLKRSFESFAQELSKKTEGDETALKRIQDTKNSIEKENSIIQFVKERMKLQPGWFLIYDNVEKISDLQKYFPQDVGTWGNGKVIITTRDSTIQNSKLVNDLINIGELNADQKLSLFTKIMTQGNRQPFTPDKLTEAKRFLEDIPSFPLDVSNAASYLIATNTPYSIYLENINRNDQDFINVQESLLKEAGEYTKSRYGILSLSFQRLLETHKDFKDLLLFICFLDSQNIPIDLLKGYKSNTLIDNFIYNLKKYSLVTSDKLLPSIGTVFSVHNSTQAVGLGYLKKMLNLDDQNMILITDSLEKYVDDAISQENLSKLMLLTSHCEAFLSHDNFLNAKIRASLESVLGCTYFYSCDYTGAKQLLEKSLVYFNEHPNENQTNIVRTLTYLGKAYRELGYYDKAKNFLEQALQIYKNHPSENNLKMAQISASLGNIYRNLCDYRRAQDLLEHSLSIYKNRFNENHVNVAHILSYLGHVYREQGKYAQAENSLEKSLTIYKQHYPKEHLGIIRAMIYLGNLKRSLGNYEIGKSLLEQSLVLYKKYFPEDHLDFSWVYVYLGNVHMDLGKYEEAKNFLEEGLLIHQKYFPPDHMDDGWIKTHFGNFYKKVGNYEKARNLLEKSITIYKKFVSEDHIDIAWASVHLASVHSSLGNYEEAKNLLEKSLAIYKQNFPENHTDIAWIKAYLGEAYYNLKNYDKALKLLEESLTTYKTLFKEDIAKITPVYVHLGNIYKELGDLTKAKNLLKKSLTICENHYGKDHIKSARTLRSLAQIYLLENNIEDAENLMNKTLTIYQQNKHSDIYTVFEDLGDLNLKKYTLITNSGNGQLSQDPKIKAVIYLKQALEVVKTHFSEDSPHALRIQSKLKGLK